MRSLVITCLASAFLVACGTSANQDTDDTINDTTGATTGGSSPTGGTTAPTGGGPDTGAGGSGSTGSGDTTTGGAGGSDDGGTPIDFGKDDYSDEDATVDDALSPALLGPTQLTKDGVPIAMTKDDRVVYRSSKGLFTVKAASGAPPRMAALLPGNVHVRGNTVFNFAEVDWKTTEGILTFWTPGVGRRSVGKAMIGDNRVAARDDAKYVLFARNLTPDTLDIVVSSADAQDAYVIVEGAGRGNPETCAPTFGFAGQAVIATWCAVGSSDATLARFTEAPGGGWQKEVLSTKAQGVWSSDTNGERLFYLANGGQAWVRDANGTKQIGTGVGWGMMHPKGEAVLFTVGDQLRRSDLKSPAVPIVTDGFKSAAAWSDDLSQVLYSNVVDYQGVKKQDLYTTPTAWFNPTPTMILDQPVATLGRSAISSDAKYGLYFTDANNQGGTLHVRSLAGGNEFTLPGVDTVVAANGSLVLITDNRSAPGVYPALVDLRVIDAANVVPYQLLQTGIDDGRNIQVTADKGRVIYRMPDGANGGIWIRALQ